MSNKHLTSPPSPMLLARLKVLLEDVNSLYSSKRMVLEGDIVNSYHQSMDIFLESLDKSVVGITSELYAGAPADPSLYNAFTNAILKDLQAVFFEVTALDKMMAASFNSLIAEREQTLQTSKRISNKLGDYLLYADPSLGGGFFFGDSFNSAENLEIGSSLVETEQCFHSSDEGLLLLPLDGKPDEPKVKTITINKSSNGSAGSNSQINIFGHDQIDVISDGEPNTWFEYEKVLVSESNTPLILDLTFALDKVSVINHININPINFGTPSPVSISVIETSKDGKEFISIKDEVPLKDFVSEEEKEEFDLSPATSKSSGQGFYSFLPRKVQFVHIVFKQHTPYSIKTLNGTRLRYAIGLRDINIVGRKFKTEGSIVSTPFTINGDIRKLSLWASENPVDKSALADISHAISYDDGASWIQIQPQGRDGSDVAEVVNFNNIAEGSISTSNTVSSLRHKVQITRTPDEFKGNVTLKQELLDQVDVVNTPAGGQESITLIEQPIKDTVQVIMPFWGSFSCPRARSGDAVANESVLMDLDFVQFSVDAPSTGTLRYRLPFRGIPNLQEKLRVFINGEQWEWCSKDEDYLDNPSLVSESAQDSYGRIHSTSKVYFLNRGGLEIQFGLTDSIGVARGYVPPAGAKIKICLDGDNPMLRLTDKGYMLSLMAPSDGIKEDLSLVTFENLEESEAEDYEFEIPPGSDQFRQTYYTELNESSKTAIRVSNSSANKDVLSTIALLANTKNVGPKQPPTKANLSYNLGNQQDSVQIGSSDKNKTIKHVAGTTSIAEGYEGLYPPVFLNNTSTTSTPNNFVIKEYNLTTGVLLSATSHQFTTPVAFIDGYTELLDSSGVKVASRYTFDSDTGTIYLGSVADPGRRTVLISKRLRLRVITDNLWSFDKDTVTNKTDTQNIILDPQSVFTVKKIKEYTYSSSSPEKSISLTSNNQKSHSWFNERLVQGTVKIDKTLFGNNTKPVEVPFVDGQSELNSIVPVIDETITFTSLGGNLYSFSLAESIDNVTKTLVGSPGFAPVRSIRSATTTASQFTDQKESTATLSADGEWKVVQSGSTVTVTLYLSSTPNDHNVNYRYKNIDSGVDINGLYSIDYYNGVIHFAETITGSGNISYESSVYSAFYNIGKVVDESDIKEINEDSKTITFNSSFGLKFLKQDEASSTRPQFLKVLYKYYNRSTESLEDIEPYFSPICKDIAFRAVTSDTLEEL